MLFPTVTFALFFAVVVTLAWALRSRPVAWRLWLVGAGAVFYGWWDVRFVGLLALMILVTWGCGRLIGRGGTRGGRVWTVVGVTGVLGVLGWFKYYGFFAATLRDALSAFGVRPAIPMLEILLPVGISFLAFEAIAYLVEVRRGAVPAARLLDVAAWLSFFPKLQSGPITRASEFLPQLAAPRVPSEPVAAEAFLLLARGLFKKVVIASFLADAIADDVFATPAAYSGVEVLVGIYAYTVQIYVDFSGYTDMARGLALLLGFDLPINFDRPYAATSIQDFWGRWHMSLSRWLRDFLFRPLVLGGHRGRVATARNLLLVMVLAGLWHGAAWTFVVWGGIHGVGLVWDRLARERRRRLGRPRPVMSGWRVAGRRVVTFHVVALAWVVFRSDSLARAGEVLARLGTWGPADAVTPLLVAVIVAVVGAQYLPRGLELRVRLGFARVGPAVQAACLGGALLVIDALGPQGVPPFIYFRF